jgi:glycerol-3-phosphate dehydrogenase
MGKREFYWCVRHERVESGDNVCAARYRIGPFDTASEAEHALERVQQRNEAWDAEDDRWEGRDR